MSQLLDVDELLEETAKPRKRTRSPVDLTHKPTVLVATSSRTLQNTAKVALESAGYRAFSATDSNAAAELLQRYPDAGMLLLDERIPGLDGYQFCKTVKQNAGPPVVMAVAKAGLWTKLKARFAGAAGVVAKPVRPDELLTIVLKQMTGSRR